MLFFLSFAYAIPWSYFISESPQAWTQPEVTPFVGEYQSSEPIFLEPIIAFWPLALRFDRDLMISLNDPTWGMIEVAQLQTKEGENLWFTLDSYQNGEQIIGLSDHPKAHEMAALFPLPSYQAHLQVEESKDMYVVSYQRLQDPIRFAMPKVTTPTTPKTRNGHAMNHSASSLLAVLDIFSLDLRPVQWLDIPYSVQKIFWQPISGVMSQTVVGFRKGEWTQEMGTLRGRDILFEEENEEYCLVDAHARYCFLKYQNQLQLLRIDMIQPMHDDVIAQVHFSPALPDLRFVPVEKSCSTMTIEMVEKKYMEGSTCIHPKEEGVTVSIEPREPYWAKLRPVISSLDIQEKEVRVHSMLLSAQAKGWIQQENLVKRTQKMKVPKRLIWSNHQLSAQEETEEREGEKISLIAALVPKEGVLAARIEVPLSSTEVYPIILEAQLHSQLSYNGIDINPVYQEGKLIVDVRVFPSSKPKIGAWMELSIGLLSADRMPSRMHLIGKKGGFSHFAFVQGFRVRHTDPILDFSIDSTASIVNEKDILSMEKLVFWWD